MATPPLPDIQKAKPPELPSDTKQVSISYSKTRELKLYPADFGDDTNEKIKTWLHEMLRVYIEKHEKLHKTLIPKWERLYLGKPREEEKSFPWPNCANLVIQIIGQQTDDIAARVIGLLYLTSPLAIYRYVAKTTDPELAAQKARILEQLFDLLGYEPSELDLYPKESRWFSESAKLGTAFLKAMPENRVEAVVVGYNEDKKKTRLKDTLLYKGPQVMNLRNDAVMMDFDADTVDESKLITHKVTLSRRELMDRAAEGFYLKESVHAILDKPDRYGADEQRKKEQREMAGAVSTEDSVLAEWDIYECWFPWSTSIGKKKDESIRKFRLIWWYHYPTKTVMNRVFNFMPRNKCAILRTKLGTGDKGAYGRGYADMLEHAQDEASTIHNQGIDATTMGMLGINTVDPAGGSSLDRHIQIYPSAIVPLKKDSFMHYDVGNPSMTAMSAQREAAILQLIEQRTGIGPAVAGMGSGQGKVGSKGNVQYGSMGTLAVMQDSNSRVNHRTSDFRHAHVQMASMLTELYGTFGLGRPGSLFGLDDDLLSQALSDFVESRIRIPIRAATASANKEVEKQNLMLLGQWVQGHHKNIISMLQAISQAQIPPEAKGFFVKVMESQNRLARQLFRSFGFDQPDEFIPDIPKEQDAANQQGNAGQGPANSNGGAVADPRQAILASLVARQSGGMGGPGGPANGGAPPNGSGAIEQGNQ